MPMEYHEYKCRQFVIDYVCERERERERERDCWEEYGWAHCRTISFDTISDPRRFMMEKK